MDQIGERKYCCLNTTFISYFKPPSKNFIHISLRVATCCRDWTWIAFLVNCYFTLYFILNTPVLRSSAGRSLSQVLHECQLCFHLLLYFLYFFWLGFSSRPFLLEAQSLRTSIPASLLSSSASYHHSWCSSKMHTFLTAEIRIAGVFFEELVYLWPHMKLSPFIGNKFALLWFTNSSSLSLWT